MEGSRPGGGRGGHLIFRRILLRPFLALLVLAALAAPKLMRRFDAATAFLRPTPFVCALERPG